MDKEAQEMTQCQFDDSTARIEELTHELEAAHQWIAKLSASGGFGVRWAAGEASASMARTSNGM